MSRVEKYMEKWERRRFGPRYGAIPKAGGWRRSDAGREAFEARWGGVYNVRKLYRLWLALDRPRRVVDAADASGLTVKAVVSLARHPSIEREGDELRRCDA